MRSFSPKIEIINHFDNLINKVDIDFELCLEKFNIEEILGELLKSSSEDRRSFRDENDCFYIKLRNTIESSSNNKWTESTKVIDYLKQVRMGTIEELSKAQEDSLTYYKLNSSHLKSQLTVNDSIDELKSKLFAEKFYFQVNLTQSTKRLWHFNLFTFVTDFYMSSSDINSLEKMINAEKEPFWRYTPVFDQKMILICLLYKSFIENLSNFPSHFINVRKQDVLNVESIHFEYDFNGVELNNSTTIDLSRIVKLELVVRDESTVRRESSKINIEGLSSLVELRLGINACELYFSLKNLQSLKIFHLYTNSVNENNTTRLFDQLQNIEELFLYGKLYYFNLDNLVNLRRLTLAGPTYDSFNFELLKNLPNQLDELSIYIDNIDYKTIVEMINCHNVSNLLALDIMDCNIQIIEKKFIDKFPSLQSFRMTNCNIETIEDKALSNLKGLVTLDLSSNLLKRLYKRYFSELVNLEYVIMFKNRIEFIENGTFSNMKEVNLLDLSDNKININDIEPFIKS